MVDQAALQNLNLQDQIVTPQGTATPFFMRLLQRKTIAAGDVAAMVDHLAAFEITTTAPIAGGPVVLGVDDTLTLSHDVSGVTPGSYTNANITVDAKGHITVAANGTVTSGTVTSVDLTAPSFLTVGGTPITTSGTIALSLTSQSANTIFAAPNGSAGTPTFRAMVAADIPNTAVTPGSYTNADITVDAQGRITAASNGSGGGGVWGPVVDGSFPPVFVQNPDGSLVLAEYV